MTPPSTIAHYKITAKLGEGGMGAVYRATDTKLNRDVAIKVLPPAFVEDAGRMARFEREAQVLASLNHPNIAATYGIEQNAIVMELVEGDDLKGPVPIETAIAYARQIATGLEGAHEKGIIHRDLKPANIKVTPDGTVKLLDFGLAKASEQSAASSTAASPTLSPTLSLAMTQAGMIMGTAAYMAPEQAAGKIVDKRADIWSFGVVLFEMLAGGQLFGAETVAHTLADVLRAPIDFGKLPPETPRPVRDLLTRCLDRDPKSRLRDIGEARVILARPMTVEPERASAAPASASRLPWVLAGVGIVGTLAVGAMWWRATRPIERPLMRFNVDLGPDAVPGPHVTVAISPDGTRIVYPVRSGSTTSLATRLLSESKATVLPATEGGGDPFFSPDGQWIGFFNRDSLRKISVLGGAAVNLVRLQSLPRGGAWSEDGFIIANLDNNRLERIPAAGGKSEPLGATPSQYNERTWRWPQILPGGDRVLFTGSLGAAVGAGYDESNVTVLSLKTNQRTVVAPQAGYYGRYLPSGHLVYIHDGVLFAVPMDLGTLKLRGTPVPVLEDVAASVGQGAGQFDFSHTGTFVYLPGKVEGGKQPVAWMDREGKTKSVLAPTTATVFSPSLSPDGKRLAVAVGIANILVADLERGTQLPLTTGSSVRRGTPIWAHDGTHLVYSEGAGQVGSLWWIRADGSRPALKLFEAKSPVSSAAFSPDGRFLVFSMTASSTDADLWTLPLDLKDPEHPIPGKPEAFSQEPGIQDQPAISPDGRWIAYSDSSGGQWNVFVRPFPANAAGGRWKISTETGRSPVWSRNGKELLFYAAPRVMAASYSTNGPTFEPGVVRTWSEAEIEGGGGTGRNFDISPDGKRIVCFPLFRDDGEAKGSVQVTVLLNFFDELKRRMP